MRKEKIYFNIWEYLDIDAINQLVDEKVKKDDLPTDIDYACLKIKKNGDIEVEANFELYQDL